MKKTLAFVATFTTLISTQPVFAVDYVACREMLRTKNEMLDKGREAEEVFWNTIGNKECPDERFTFTDNIRKGYDFTNYHFDEMIKCRELARDAYKSTHKPIIQLKTNITINPHKHIDNNNIISISEIYDTTASGWIKSSNKVLVDMKKAGCPYQ